LPPASDGPRIEFPLPNDNSIEICLKKPVSKKDFERIKKLVELSEASLVEEKAAMRKNAAMDETPYKAPQENRR
jgi:hypothetical protein